MDADGEIFGEERLVEFVKKNRKREAREIVDRLFKHLSEFGGKEKWQDDATLMIVKRLD